MQERLAKFISALFHPMFVPSFGLLVFFNSNLSLYVPTQAKSALFYFVLFFTSVLPCVFLPILKHRKIISSYQMNERKERFVPLIVFFVSYATALFLLLRVNLLPSIIIMYLLGSVITILIVLIITIRWKISIHTAGLGGLSFVVLYLDYHSENNLNIFLFAVIAISGLVAYSRMKLNEHNPPQVYFGFLVGFLAVSIGFLI